MTAPLEQRLTAIITEARAAGYAVVLFYPEELIGIDNEALQVRLTVAGKALINASLEPEPED